MLEHFPLHVIHAVYNEVPPRTNRLFEGLHTQATPLESVDPFHPLSSELGQISPLHRLPPSLYVCGFLHCIVGNSALPCFDVRVG